MCLKPGRFLSETLPLRSVLQEQAEARAVKDEFERRVREASESIYKEDVAVMQADPAYQQFVEAQQAGAALSAQMVVVAGSEDGSTAYETETEEDETVYTEGGGRESETEYETEGGSEYETEYETEGAGSDYETEYETESEASEGVGVLAEQYQVLAAAKLRAGAWSKPHIRDTTCCCHPLTTVPYLRVWTIAGFDPTSDDRGQLNPGEIVQASAPQSMQQTWTVLQHDGPDHLGLWHAAPLVSMQQTWTVLQHDGPDHLGLWHAAPLVSMQQTWTVLQHDGPDHLGFLLIRQSTAGTTPPVRPQAKAGSTVTGHTTLSVLNACIGCIGWLSTALARLSLCRRPKSAICCLCWSSNSAVHAPNAASKAVRLFSDTPPFACGAAGVMRVLTDRGWVSTKAGDGTVLLEPLDDVSTQTRPSVVPSSRCSRCLNRDTEGVPAFYECLNIRVPARAFHLVT